jgi:hypothetical protein
MPDPTRKLAAIVFNDIVGFTKLLSENEPAELALLETQRDLFTTAVYFLCLKQLNREYDVSELYKLIEEEKGDIGYTSNYYIYKLLGQRSYLKDAYDKILKMKSNLDPEVAEKFINYPEVKAVFKEWKMNI